MGRTAQKNHETVLPAPMRGVGVLLTAICLLLLTSCDFMAADTESLLTPPTLNNQQAEVHKALAATLNMDDVTYRYPQRGEYRTPFILFDMDGDGSDEAIFFYTFSSDPTSTRVKILKQLSSGRWESLHDIAEISDQVDFIQFSRLLDAEAYCMIIGWQSTMGQTSLLADSFLGVYSLVDGRITTEIQRHPYVEYAVEDFDGDGLEEIVTVSRGRDQMLEGSLLRAVGRHLGETATVPMNTQAEVLLGMTTGRLWDGSRAVYIDEVRGDSSTATEIFRVSDGGIAVLVGGEPGDSRGEEEEEDAQDAPWENYLSTWRDTPVISRDYDGDGVVEVPNPTALPGTVYEGDEDPLQLIRLMHLTQDGFDIRRSAVVNENDGYMVYFPDDDRWTNWVTVVRDDEIHEWKFFLVEIMDADGLITELTTELLRITTYMGADNVGMGANEIDLGRSGTRQYAGYIPRTAEGLPSVSEEELLAMFHILPQTA